MEVTFTLSTQTSPPTDRGWRPSAPESSSKSPNVIWGTRAEPT